VQPGPQTFVAPQVEGLGQVPHCTVRGVPQVSINESEPHAACARAQSCAAVSGTHAHVPFEPQV
jgi:hypothetical protein